MHKKFQMNTQNTLEGSKFRFLILYAYQVHLVYKWIQIGIRCWIYSFLLAVAVKVLKHVYKCCFRGPVR